MLVGLYQHPIGVNSSDSADGPWQTRVKVFNTVQMAGTDRKVCLSFFFVLFCSFVFAAHTHSAENNRDHPPFHCRHHSRRYRHYHCNQHQHHFLRQVIIIVDLGGACLKQGHWGCEAEFYKCPLGSDASSVACGGGGGSGGAICVFALLLLSLLLSLLFLLLGLLLLLLLLL